MLPFLAAGFGFGLLFYPWLSPSHGTLSLPEEAARQLVLLLVTLFIAAKVEAPPRPSRFPLWVPALCAFVAAALLRASVLSGMPFVPGDEDEYLFQARIFARGHLTAPAPQEPEAFWAPGILVRNGRWFGHHQPGHGLLLGFGLLVGVPWLVPALSTGLTVLFLALTARTLADQEAGAMTGLLALSSPMLILTGASLVSETSSLALVAAVFWLLLAEPLGPRWSATAAGLALGFLLNVRVVTGVAATGASIVVLGSRARRLLPGLVMGLVCLLVHNALTAGSPLRFPFQLYEPHALGFKGSFTPLKAVSHLLRNVLLLNFWLLGWPCSFLLLRPTPPRRLGVAGVVFVALLVLGTTAYWHPGQVATGPLRLHEAVFFLLLLSGLTWHRAAKATGLLSRYVPLAIAAAHLGFVPVREAVLAGFVREVHEPRRAVAALAAEDRVVVLSGRGDLFHYPVNDPWLSHRPLMVREGFGVEEGWPPHRRILLVQDCEGTRCAWHLGSPKAPVRPRAPEASDVIP